MSLEANCPEPISKYTTTEARKCYTYIKNKSEQYKEMIKNNQLNNAATLEQKIESVKKMEKIMNILLSQYKGGFGSSPYMPLNLQGLRHDLSELLNQNLKMEIDKMKPLKCGSATHDPKNNDKPVYLCIICKEPRCSICMPYHLESIHLSVKIDAFTFLLVEKYNKVHDYYVVKIKNVDLNLDFFVYRSNSEGGIYRLCTYDHTNEILYKGTNYVTTSYIHIQLQIFINKNYDKIPVAKNDLPISIDKLCPDVRSRCNDCGNNIIRYKDFIEKEDRMDNNKFLKILQICECGSCFKHIHTLFIKTLNIYYELETAVSEPTKANFWRTVGIDNKNIVILKIKLLEFVKKNIGYYRTYLRTIDFNDLSMDTLRNIIEKEAPKIKLPDDYKIEIFKNYLKMVGDYLKDITEIVRGKEYLGTYKFIPKKDQQVSLTFNIYSIKLRIKNSDIYNFIVAQYEYINTVNPTYNGTYNTILNVVPDNVSINRLGLYSKYVNMGIYICKIFEYHEHSMATVVGAGRKLSSKSQYIFIGDLYTDVFPLNLLTK